MLSCAANKPQCGPPIYVQTFANGSTTKLQALVVSKDHKSSFSCTQDSMVRPDQSSRIGIRRKKKIRCDRAVATHYDSDVILLTNLIKT